jgi:hypothetical protein
MTKYEDMPCERCGSKKIVSRVWTEPTEVFGKMIDVECRQIICSNEVCQKSFDNNQKKESKKKAILVKQKEERDVIRKENIRVNAANRKKALENA